MLVEVGAGGGGTVKDGGAAVIILGKDVIEVHHFGWKVRS